MAATYEPIASQTLTANAGTVTFSGIPSGDYTDIILTASARCASASTDDSLYLRFNNDAGSNYSYTYIAGNGGSATSSRFSSYPLLYLGQIAGATSTSGYFTPFSISLMSAGSGSVYKTSLVSVAGTEGTYSILRGVGLWRSTSAITSLTLYPDAQFVAGSTFSLFGLAAA